MATLTSAQGSSVGRDGISFDGGRDPAGPGSGGGGRFLAFAVIPAHTELEQQPHVRSAPGGTNAVKFLGGRRCLAKYTERLLAATSRPGGGTSAAHWPGS